MAKLKIIVESAGIEMTATLNDCKTAQELKKVLPLEGKAQVWGDEIYFPVPVTMSEDNAHDTVPSGTIAYWPPGHAFCIFFGQTPYSAVNVLGEVEGDPNTFAEVKSGATVRLEPTEA